MNAAVAARLTAEERREEILAAAITRFGQAGYHGTSAERIATDVGVSQPYVFRLYGTKKALFIAAVEWAFGATLEAFRAADADAVDGADALKRIGRAYWELLQDERYLPIQMQAYAACGDPEIRAVVQAGFSRLVDELRRFEDLSARQIAVFLGDGMLLNVAGSMGVLGAEDGWAAFVRDGCREVIDG